MGDGEIGRLGDWEMRRLGDEESGRREDWVIERLADCGRFKCSLIMMGK